MQQESSLKRWHTRASHHAGDRPLGFAMTALKCSGKMDGLCSQPILSCAEIGLCWSWYITSLGVFFLARATEKNAFSFSFFFSNPCHPCQQLIKFGNLKAWRKILNWSFCNTSFASFISHALRPMISPSENGGTWESGNFVTPSVTHVVLWNSLWIYLFLHCKI